MEERASVDCAAADEVEEDKKQKALAAWVSVGSLSLLLAGLMAFMAGSHGEAPLWLVAELCAVLCLLLYLRAYHLTQSITITAVPVDALVFAFPLVFGAGFLAALAVGPMAGVLVMVHIWLLRVLPRRVRADRAQEQARAG